MVPTEPSPPPTRIDAVVFDWYATLARPLDDGWWGRIRELIADGGGSVDEPAVRAWEAMPTDHREWSHSCERYQAWGAERFRRLLAICGVHPDRIDDVAAASERIRTDEVVPAIDGAHETLVALRAAGLRVALCSNWDWDLDRHLEANGLADAFDVVVSSAIVGYRKPHRAIFELVLDRLGVAPSATVFVGDDLTADIDGATAAGLFPVHAAWSTPCSGGHGPDVACCTSFAQLLALPLLEGALSGAGQRATSAPDSSRSRSATPTTASRLSGP